MTRPILNCELHDYLEIACLFKIDVELLLANGSSYVGTPLTTHSDNGEEFLAFRSRENKTTVDILTLSLESMRALNPNTHFDRVVFSAN